MIDQPKDFDPQLDMPPERPSFGLQFVLWAIGISAGLGWSVLCFYLGYLHGAGVH